LKVRRKHRAGQVAGRRRLWYGSSADWSGPGDRWSPAPAVRREESPGSEGQSGG